MTAPTTPQAQVSEEDAARVNRVLGYMDGFADQWAAEQNIQDQIVRMMGLKASAPLVKHILKWTKQAYAEGAYRGYTEAQATAKTHIIAPLESALESALSAPPAQDDVAALVEALEPFARVAKYADGDETRRIFGRADFAGNDWREITIGDLHRAAQSLARVRKEG